MGKVVQTKAKPRLMGLNDGNSIDEVATNKHAGSRFRKIGVNSRFLVIMIPIILVVIFSLSLELPTFHSFQSFAILINPRQHVDQGLHRSHWKRY